MIDLERLPSLETVQLTAQSVRLICAVYFLFDNGELVYIEKATNMHERIGQHLRDKMFDSYAFIEIEPARAIFIERAYIGRYRPKYNKQIPTKDRSLRLKSVLADFCIKLNEFAEGVKQTKGRGAGKSLSLTAVSQIVNWDIWPSATPRDEITQQVKSFLRSRGVPENRLRHLWMRSDELTVRPVAENAATASYGGL